MAKPSNRPTPCRGSCRYGRTAKASFSWACGKPKPAAGNHGAVPVDPDALFEQLLDGANLNLAWQQVKANKANKGAPGMDGMTFDEFPAFAREHWERIRSQLSEGTYHPAPVRRVFI